MIGENKENGGHTGVKKIILWCLREEQPIGTWSKTDRQIFITFPLKIRCKNRTARLFTASQNIHKLPLCWHKKCSTKFLIGLGRIWFRANANEALQPKTAPSTETTCPSQFHNLSRQITAIAIKQTQQSTWARSFARSKRFTLCRRFWIDQAAVTQLRARGLAGESIFTLI